MRIITLEEHVIFPELTSQLSAATMAKYTLAPLLQQLAPTLDDIDGARLQSMDEQGISLQILSVIGAGADLLSAEESPAFAKQYNDLLAARIAKHPDRFAAFAHLPMTAPQAAADELERTVKSYQFKGALINGLTQGKFLDDAMFAPILQKAEELRVPIYLHPGLPPKAVADAYYSGLPGDAGISLSVSGWGWHSETAMHILRMIIAGTFDKYPRLKMVIGHMGEMLPMMMARCDDKLKQGINQRSISETLKAQVHITTSGIFTLPPLTAAIDTFGIDNVMFSVDYPFSSNEEGKRFLERLALPEDQLHKLAHGNAERLFGV